MHHDQVLHWVLVRLILLVVDHVVVKVLRVLLNHHERIAMAMDGGTSRLVLRDDAILH